MIQIIIPNRINLKNKETMMVVLWVNLTGPCSAQIFGYTLFLHVSMKLIQME